MNLKKYESRDIVITVSGLHGSGRSTQSRMLAETFNLRYVSIGSIFRELADKREISLEEMSLNAEKSDELDKYIDAMAKTESLNGKVVIDATLSAWMAVEPDIKIYLWTPFEERVKSIAKREGRNIEKVIQETRTREESERERFLLYYNIDTADLSVYDIVLNTGLYDADAVARILKKIVEEYMVTK
jgi:cytidylate kinase